MFLKGIIIQGLEVNKSATWEKQGTFIRAGMFIGIKKIYKALLHFRDVCISLSDLCNNNEFFYHKFVSLILIWQ